MSKRISGCIALLAFLGLTLFLINCGSSSSRPAAVLYYLSQGENNVGSFAINLNSGALSLSNRTSAAGAMPSTILLDPTGNVAYVLNTGSPNTITAYTVNSDGTLSAPTSQSLPVQNSVAMARDAAGTFLAVVSQGSIPLPGSAPCPHPEPNSECPAITVFTIQSGSTTLTQAGDPFPLSFVPTSVTASITGTFNNPSPPNGTVDGTLLQVTGNEDLTINSNDNTISEFAVQASGVITGPLNGSPYVTATNPSSVVAVRTSPTGGTGGLFVYVTNATDDNVNVYQVCTASTGTTCSGSDDVQNAKMTPVGVTVSVGQEPMAMTVDPTNNFLYVVNHGSNTVSAFRINPTTGALSALNPSTVSTGLNPVAISMHSSGKFLYVSNNGSSNVSGFNADTTSGALSNATNVTSSAQPAGLVAK